MWAKLFIILKPHTNQDTSLIGKSLCHIASLFKFAFACDLVDASPPQKRIHFNPFGFLFSDGVLDPMKSISNLFPQKLSRRVELDPTKPS